MPKSPNADLAISVRAARAAIATLMLVALAACSSRTDDWFPLAGGRSWQYHVERTTMDGTTALKHIVESRGETGWSGQQVSEQRTLAGTSYFYRRANRGVELVARRLAGDAPLVAQQPPILLLPPDPQPGQSWEQEIATTVLENSGPPWETLFRIKQSIPVSYRVEKLTETVTVPAGTFENCLVIRASGKTTAEVGNYIRRATISVDMTEWYARGVGLVRSQRIERTDADALNFGELTMELEHVHK